MALEVAIAAYVAAAAPLHEAVFAALAAAGPLLLAVGLRLRWLSFVPLSIVILGGVYACALRLSDELVDGGAPLVGAAALLAAELAYWAAASRAVPVERALVRRELATSGALVATALFLGTLVLLAGGVSVGGGLPLEALGVAAAATALALVARLARS